MNNGHIIELKKRYICSVNAPKVSCVTPLKSAAPFVLRKLGRAVQVDATTFFGRSMKVVLPEMVSVSIWRHGFFEEDVCAYLLNVLRPDDAFVDIGGHFGFFSMLARELVGSDGSVVTFEPMPRTRMVLNENMEKYAGPARHHLIPAAAGASAGRLRFKDFGLTGSAFATSASARSANVKLLGEVDVDVRTVDNVVEGLGLSALRLIKIDAENAEYDVVQGSLNTLRTLRPALILETGDSSVEGSTTCRVLEALLAENYEPYEFHNWSIVPHSKRASYGYGNLLLLPSERTAEVIVQSLPLSGTE